MLVNILLIVIFEVLKKQFLGCYQTRKCVIQHENFIYNVIFNIKTSYPLQKRVIQRKTVNFSMRKCVIQCKTVPKHVTRREKMLFSTKKCP